MAAALLPAVAHLLKEHLGLLQPGTGQRILSPDAGHSAQQIEGGGYARCVTQFPVECQALPTQRLCPLHVIQARGQFCCRVQCPGSQRSCHTLASCQCPLQEDLPFSPIATVIPEPVQGGTQAQRVLSLHLSGLCVCLQTCPFQEKTECCSQVLLVAFQL